MLPPSEGQVEINIFGPGFGESSAIHLGDGKWIIIDSCLDIETRQPAALKYLRDIGVQVADAVKLVVATHWHDDHVRGLAETFEQCKSARFCSSAALTRPEFLETVEAYNTRHDLIAGSGTSEICRVLRILRDRTPRTGIRAIGVRKLIEIPANEMSHKFDCDVLCLSPADAQLDRAMVNIAKLFPQEFTQKIRAPTPSENDLSIAAWVSVGPISMLFGADLEEDGDPELGWSAVLSSAGLPKNKAFFFKIPHHGSSNGHHDKVWADLLEENPYAVLTPWARNKGLPQISDIERIIALTSRAFSTSNGKLVRSKRRTQIVEKTLRISGIQLSAIESRTGHVRIRNGGANDFNSWSIELSDVACRLDELCAVEA